MKSKQSVGMYGLSILMMLSGSHCVLAEAGHFTKVKSSSQQNSNASNEYVEGFKLFVKLDQHIATSAGDVILDVTLEKGEGKPIKITERGIDLSYKLEIICPDGTLSPLTSLGEKASLGSLMMNSQSSRVYKVGDVHSFSMHGINAYFDMTQPGEYSLQVSRLVPSLDDSTQQVRIYSNVVTLTLLSPNQTRALEIKQRQTSFERLRRWRVTDKKSRPAKDFALAIAATRSNYAPGDRIAFDATLENRGADVSFTDEPQYKIEVMQADGALVPMTPSGEEAQGIVEPLGAPSASVLQGGTHQVSHLYTGTYYDLHQPGDYFLRVSREVPRRDGNGQTVTLYSNAMKFTVEAPKDETPKPAK